MRRNLTEAYVIPELTIKLCDIAGNVIDKAIANDVGVTVEFDYVRGNREDKAQVYIKSIKSAGAALDGDDVTLNLWAARDIQGFLMQPDIDAIVEELVDRLEAREKADADDARIDAAIDARADELLFFHPSDD